MNNGDVASINLSENWNKRADDQEAKRMQLIRDICSCLIVHAADSQEKTLRIPRQQIDDLASFIDKYAHKNIWQLTAIAEAFTKPVLVENAEPQSSNDESQSDSSDTDMEESEECPGCGKNPCYASHPTTTLSEEGKQWLHEHNPNSPFNP